MPTDVKRWEQASLDWVPRPVIAGGQLARDAELEQLML
jgi:hypothetical protein